MLIIKLNVVKSQKCFFIPPKNFNSLPFINIGRETPFLGKNEIQALIYLSLSDCCYTSNHVIHKYFHYSHKTSLKYKNKIYKHGEIFEANHSFLWYEMIINLSTFIWFIVPPLVIFVTISSLKFRTNTFLRTIHRNNNQNNSEMEFGD